MIRRLLLLAMALAFGCGAVPALADKRVALVIGNSTYRNIVPLDNPKNDAALMARTLSGLGFTLIGGGPLLDVDKAALDQAIQKFGDRLQGAEVGMFYYAGHGVQVRGANYLVPVNANPTREADVDFQMVDVGDFAPPRARRPNVDCRRRAPAAARTAVPGVASAAGRV
jgi:uncharacterized caspase-like protein